jgi:hypothetical protein
MIRASALINGRMRDRRALPRARGGWRDRPNAIASAGLAQGHGEKSGKKFYVAISVNE